MNKLSDAVKTIAAVVGVGMVIYHAGTTVAGKADAAAVSEVESRLSVVESRLSEMDKKLDRLLER